MRIRDGNDHRWARFSSDVSPVLKRADVATFAVNAELRYTSYKMYLQGVAATPGECMEKFFAPPVGAQAPVAQAAPVVQAAAPVAKAQAVTSLRRQSPRRQSPRLPSIGSAGTARTGILESAAYRVSGRTLPSTASGTWMGAGHTPKNLFSITPPATQESMDTEVDAQLQYETFGDSDATVTDAPVTGKSSKKPTNPYITPGASREGTEPL
ncbi:hypothetical protein BDZ91DRAFT_728222 [Kalaharituber pfeilii]|nr:hypothetical protein BDZ91DRAFT_728222 [Kalaharituber pfeilii]